MKAMIAGGAIACLAACATAPENIAPRQADAASFASFTCAQLEAQRAQVSASLGNLETSQRNTRRADAVGVALVLLPIGSLVGGNHAKEIGELKGQRDALQTRIAQAECYGSSSADAPISINGPTQQR